MPLPSLGPEIHELLIAYIQDRLAVGIDTYGMGLRAFNGRDGDRDALEEAIDLATYLVQVRLEREQLFLELSSALQDVGDQLFTKRAEEFVPLTELRQLLERLLGYLELGARSVRRDTATLFVAE